MKTLLLFVVIVGLAGLGWFGFMRLSSMETAPATPAVATAPAPKPAITTPPPAPPMPAPAPIEAIATSAPRSVVAAPKPTLTPAQPSTVEPIDLALTLDPDGHFHDDLRGVSANLPGGWSIRSAVRWGEGNLQNTVMMMPETPSRARPSMYYQPYPNNQPDMSSPEAYLRGVAQSKENSRSQNGLNDYKNVPDSFEFTEIGGHPALTYFATFTAGDQVMTEHFIRVLGPTGYVMFFTTGKFDDVKTILPQLKAMAGSLKAR